MNPNDPGMAPVREAELHAFIDGQLTPERQAELDLWLAQRPDEASRVTAYREQKRALRALFDPVLAEPLPPRLAAAARQRRPWHPLPAAAGFLLALLGGVAGWALHASVAPAPAATASASPLPSASATAAARASAFAQRAAVAHAVFSPEVRRPVEVDAAHEDQLVTWLSKRMGAPMKPPHLQSLGYALEGGRLLPGGQGPVAQFMYRDEAGQRLTLYVSNEVAELASPAGSASGAAFRFAREGELNVFYWVEGRFGYALSAAADRNALAAVSNEVYRQLAAR